MPGAINALKNKNTYSHPTAINTLYRNTYFTGPLPISCYMYTHSKPSAVLHSTDTHFHANSCSTPCRNTHSHVHCSCTLEKHTFTCPLLSCTLQKHTCTCQHPSSTVQKHILTCLKPSLHSTKRHIPLCTSNVHFKDIHSHRPVL